MPTAHLRSRLIDRLVKSAALAGELGLALLMTAGVAHCGGSTQTKGEGTSDGAADHGLAIEAAQEGGMSIEAPAYDAYPTVEAAVFPDAGSDGHPSPLPEAPAPPPDAGSDAHGPVVEAAVFPDAGTDGHVSPIIEAPSPVVDAGSDAHRAPWVEAPTPA
jgi:hypothetical protein